MTRMALSLLVCVAWLASGPAWGEDTVAFVPPAEAVSDAPTVERVPLAAPSIDLMAAEPGASIRTAQFDAQEQVALSQPTPAYSANDDDDDDDWKLAWVFFIVSISTFTTIMQGSTPAQH